MTETEQLELPLAVQRSDFKQTEFPWRILCDQKGSPRKRSAGAGPRTVRIPRAASARSMKDCDGFTFLGLAFAVAQTEAIAAVVAETPVEIVEEAPPFRLEV